MAPEAHGAQVLPDPDFGPKNMIPPTKTDLPYNFCFINFFPSFTVQYDAEVHHVPGVENEVSDVSERVWILLCADVLKCALAKTKQRRGTSKKYIL